MNYTVIIPVFNGAQTVVGVVKEVFEVFKLINETVEVILIDDYSTDNSWSVINKLVDSKAYDIKAIRLSKNFGQHNAIFCGLNFTKGSYIITIDDDGQNPPSEIPKLIKRIRETDADIVYGLYAEKKHNIFRNISSNIVQVVFKNVFKAKGNFTAFRCMKKQLAQKIIKVNKHYIFLDGIIQWHTNNVAYTEVQHTSRTAGESGYSLLKLLKLSSNMVFNFTTLPLRLLVIIGAVGSIVSFIAAMVYLYRYFVWAVPMGFSSIILSILFLGSAIMFGFGILSEYLIRIYNLQNEKPAFSIDEQIGA